MVEDCLARVSFLRLSVHKTLGSAGRGGGALVPTRCGSAAMGIAVDGGGR